MLSPSMECVPPVLSGRLPVEEPGVESEPAHLEGALRRRAVILSLGAHVWPNVTGARQKISPTSLFLPDFTLFFSLGLALWFFRKADCELPEDEKAEKRRSRCGKEVSK